MLGALQCPDSVVFCVRLQFGIGAPPACRQHSSLRLLLFRDTQKMDSRYHCVHVHGLHPPLQQAQEDVIRILA